MNAQSLQWQCLPNRSIPEPVPEPMDFRYLKQHVGDALAQGLSDVACAQPKDPVEHLGKWLLKYIDNQSALKAAEADKACPMTASGGS